jgi:hypothetical protein
MQFYLKGVLYLALVLAGTSQAIPRCVKHLKLGEMQRLSAEIFPIPLTAIETFPLLHLVPQRLAIPNSLTPGKVIFVTDQRYPLATRRLEPGFIEFKDVKGRDFYFRKEEPSGSGKLDFYQQVQQSETPFPRIPLLATPFPLANFRIPRDLQAFGAQLAKNQITNSSSCSAATPSERKQFLDALTVVNTDMLNFLTLGASLNEETLKDWNFHLLKCVPPKEKHVALLAGMLRGTCVNQPAPSGERDAFITLDLGGVLSAISYTSNASVLAAPPEAIPGALSQFLAEINGFSRDTPFQTVALTFRKFITLHPFVEGNGRIARILLDYSLLRAGFPPAPSFTRGEHLVLFTSEEESVARLAALYTSHRK